MLFLVFIIYVILAFLLIISSLLVVISLEIRQIRSLTTTTSTTAAIASEPVFDYEILPKTLHVPGCYTPAPSAPLSHAVFSTPAPSA
jgi:hypothetical protein